ncbi:MAG: tRNA pseudouridine(55) synthase TruB [Lachnospiraceae bacterium]|nr:tRNA pseudouridine(55) synthase TruB [Lachnospiraceae bacterium]
MKSGIINVYKEKGYTSFDVVARMRGIMKMKKIGHTGTLDPDAEGVLPVCLGNATRVCAFLTDKRKEYVAECILGVTTDTQDMTGTVLSRKPVEVAESAVRSAVMGFVGPCEQIPPMYSAIKVNGKRLYEIARRGEEVERQPRLITIYEIEILKIDLPIVRFRVVCSKGTYIRTLCHDIGEALVCGGAMQSLVRTKVDMFTIDKAKKLDEIEKLVKEENTEDLITPVDALFLKYPGHTVLKEAERLVSNGNTLTASSFENPAPRDEKIRVYGGDGRFYGIYAKTEQEIYKPLKMFL